MRRLTAGEGATLAGLLLVVALVAGLPLGRLAAVALTEGGAPSLAPVLRALDSAAVGRALWASLDSAAVSAALSTALGAAMALALGLTDVRGRAALSVLLLMPMMIPPHVAAIAWLQATGPSSPLLAPLGLAPPMGRTNPLYGREGVIALLALQHAPLAFLTLRAGLRALPREMVEAARVAGAGPARALGRVALPLVAPSLVAAFALCFVSALGNFGIPALLGAPGRYVTLPVLMWRRLASFGPGMLADVAALAAVIGALAVVALALALRLQRRTRAALVGPAAAPLALRLGPARPWVEAGFWAFAAATVALPLASLTATALSPTYGVALTPQTATLAHLREVLLAQSVTARAFANSALAAGAAALAAAALAVGLGWFLTRPPGPARRAAGAAWAALEGAYAVPGLVVSVAFILVFIRPVAGVSLYGSLTVIALAYVAAFSAVALKPVTAAYGQLDPALDDAARVAGAGFWLRMARVFLPLTAPAAASGALLVFLTAYNEVTVSALLWSRGSETIGTVIFNYEDGGYTTLASAMALTTVAATLALMAALDRLGRGLPPGVIPWRD